MSNIKIGDKSERNVIEIFKKYNYWVYNTPHKTSGQPVDIICIKGCPSVSWLIDAKHIDSKTASFSFDRIEPNQETTFMYASGFAQLGNLGFAIDWDRTGQVYFLPYETYCEMKSAGKNSAKIEGLEKLEERIENVHNNIK